MPIDLKVPAIGESVSEIYIGQWYKAEGDRIEISPAATVWFASAARGLRRGYAIVIDYGYPAAELYRAHRLAGTVRAHRGHTVSDDPFAHVGEQDLYSVDQHSYALRIEKSF